MNNKFITILISFILIAGAFYAGYRTGSHGSSPEAEPSTAPSLYSKWVFADKPPLPVILIEGQDIKVYRGSYSWSQVSGKGGNDILFVDADTASPPMMKTTVAPAGSQIESHALLPRVLYL
ncbi:hypothetical protein PaeBR_05130 [Paenibacillus sp. BR2-3]|uniref:hypothetical protein n=1 Tax=Paenibacillus sp. BR2-3 TaxID=3048494 RepID=UPI0039775454